MLRIPNATYRIQFNLDFRFTDARELVPYLHELGITDLYASPRFKARKGSSHGYDVADPRRVNSELGTEREFEELAAKLKSYSMGLLLDIVPNHMAASHENPWWMDVLENGPSSRYAEYFDIDWHPAITKAAFLQDNRVLLPVLGDLYGNVLENGELALKLDEAGFFIQYYDHRFPLDPKSYKSLIESIAEGLKQSPETGPELHAAFAEMLAQIREIPVYTSGNAAERGLRESRGRRIKDTLWEHYHPNPEVRRITDEIVRSVNGTKHVGPSFFQLDQIISEQPYRLSFWKIGLEEINYRRFFDVNDLVGLRVEIPRVFADRHRAILQLIHEGLVTGLRVDHVDGLYDPLEYLKRLQGSAFRETPAVSPQVIYVVVEKILGEREALPVNWPVAGTTGYDFLNAVNAVFIDRKGLAAVEEGYQQLLAAPVPFTDASYEGNKLVMDMLFAGEVRSLGHHLGKLAAEHRQARDLPLTELIQAMKEVTACLPVYRTYISGWPVSQRDGNFLNRALHVARSRVSQKVVSDAAFSFFRQVLFLEPPEFTAGVRDEYIQFVMRWQQFTGPVMAKGLEDTAFYVHDTLVSLNEVGGDPSRESLPLDPVEFHQSNAYRQLHWPHTLNATATHDTKRGEDIRARINVLSEFPRDWQTAFRRWHRWNSSVLEAVAGSPVPALNEEWLLYQTMLGAWPNDAQQVPDFRERLKSFAVKAAREAKKHTDWINPDAAYEAALEKFIERVFSTQRANRFLPDFQKFQKKVAFYGFLNSLSQTLLKIGSPGVPDFYQGCELWDYNLVDPDNRRSVDFGARTRILAEIKELDRTGAGDLLKILLRQWKDGRVKSFLSWKALNCRNRNRDVFLHGEYLPLSPVGEFKHNLCAFARRFENQWVVIAVPRLLSRVVPVGHLPLGEAWGDSRIQFPHDAPSNWLDEFTGRRLKLDGRQGKRSLRLSQLFSSFPVALCSSVQS